MSEKAGQSKMFVHCDLKEITKFSLLQGVSLYKKEYAFGDHLFKHYDDGVSYLCYKDRYFPIPDAELLSQEMIDRLCRGLIHDEDVCDDKQNLHRA